MTTESTHHLKKDYEELRFQAAVLFIKHGCPIREIVKKLGIPSGKLQKWSNDGKWNELRPDIKIDKNEGIKHQAAILYIKEGLTAIEVGDKLNISQPTILKWNKAGRWADFRTDKDKLNEYKAASLYIEKGLTANEISQRLSTPETLIKLWIYVNGWDAARLVSQSQDTIAEIVTAFSTHFKSLFPRDAAQIEVAKDDYIKKLTSK
jgi:uncharacterized protein YjcR